MSLRLRSIAQALLLASGIAVIPACGTNAKLAAPNILNTNPLGGGVISRAPLIVFQFDRPMDPNFITQIYFGFNLSGTNTAVPFTVENVPSLNEVRIIPTSLLTVGQAYDIFATGTIQSAAGTPMGSAEGITVTVEAASTVVSGMSFGTPAVGAPDTTSGDIVLTWTAATETIVVGSNPPASANVTNYDIYVSIAADNEDLFLQPFVTSTSLTGQTINLPLHGAVYHIKVLPRDGEGNVLEVSLPEITATTVP